MKKRTFCAAMALLFTLCAAAPAFAAEGGTGAPIYENTVELAGGLSFGNVISFNSSGKRVEGYTLETTAGGDVYPIVMAEDMIYSAMNIEEMVAYAESTGLNVLGAVNADFFYSSMSLPLGGVIQDGRYISDMNGENMLAFTDSGAFCSVKPDVTMTLDNKGGGRYFDYDTGEFIDNQGKSVTVDHYNKVRTNAGGLFLYNSAFHSESTNTSLPGWAVIFRIISGEITVSGTVELQVEKVIPSGTDYPLEEGHMVLTSQANGRYPDTYKDFSAGDRVTLTTVCSDERLSNAVWGTGCGDMLVENGEMTDPEGWDQDLIKSHPRTAIGIKDDGSVVAYVVDGRSSTHSNGALMEEISADLIAKGCKTVVNLDGGGSSAMVVKLPGDDTCTVVNRPSDGKPRDCSTYILFVSDRKPDGIPARLGIENDGAFVLAGSPMGLEFTCTDRSGNPAPVPEDIDVSCELGTYDDGVYFAGGEPGVDKLSLRSHSTGITGTATVHITDTVDSLTVTDAETGERPVLSDLEDGAVLELNVSATYLTRPVSISRDNVEYELTMGLGDVTEGVITFRKGEVTEGELTVSAGGQTLTYPVTFEAPVGFEDAAGHWAEESINRLYALGVVTGNDDGLYHPDGQMTRGGFVMMIWNALGKPTVDGVCQYTDVPEGIWYYDAVNWSQAVGLTSGSGDGIFNPDGSLTRQDAFTLIYKLLDMMRLELPTGDETTLADFSDAGDISDYALAPVTSLAAYGLVSGNDNMLMPKKGLTRAEMAMLLCKALF